MYPHVIIGLSVAIMAPIAAAAPADISDPLSSSAIALPARYSIPPLGPPAYQQAAVLPTTSPVASPAPALPAVHTAGGYVAPPNAIASIFPTRKSVEPKPLPPVDENVSIPLRGSRKPTTLGVKTIGTVAEPSTVGVSSSVLKKEVEDPTTRVAVVKAYSSEEYTEYPPTVTPPPASTKGSAKTVATITLGTSSIPSAGVMGAVASQANALAASSSAASSASFASFAANSLASSASSASSSASSLASSASSVSKAVESGKATATSTGCDHCDKHRLADKDGKKKNAAANVKDVKMVVVMAAAAAVALWML